LFSQDEQKILQKIEAVHDLFASDINTFLKIKQEASGFPDGCETDEQQKVYIQDILRRGGQQSKKEFLLRDGATELDFFHLKYPEGSGGNSKKHLHLNKENFKRSKRAIVQVSIYRAIDLILLTELNSGSSSSSSSEFKVTQTHWAISSDEVSSVISTGTAISSVEWSSIVVLGPSAI
jgi:hypothetical protein